MKDIVTSDLSNFGSRERAMLVELLKAWKKQGLPKGFYDEEVTPVMNRISGFVFLTNSEYQSAMMNGDTLELWYHCCNCGNEGFKEDCKILDDYCCSCISDNSPLDDNNHYMNRNTGTVKSGEQWLDDYITSKDTCHDYLFEDLSTLVEVDKDENGNWVPV